MVWCYFYNCYSTWHTCNAIHVLNVELHLSTHHIWVVTYNTAKSVEILMILSNRLLWTSVLVYLRYLKIENTSHYKKHVNSNKIIRDVIKVLVGSTKSFCYFWYHGALKANPSFVKTLKKKVYILKLVLRPARRVLISFTYIVRFPLVDR